MSLIPTLGVTLVAVALLATPLHAACRQALAIGLDISGSVDRQEHRLQLDGLAGALSDEAVQNAFVAFPNALIRLFVYEWSGTGVQHPLLGWQDINDKSDLNNIAALLRATTERPQGLRTALGRAMLFGAINLNAQNDCWRLTLDIVGDGKSNLGPRPRDIRKQSDFLTITINALVIGSATADSPDPAQSQIADLNAYFRSEVIQGPQAFVETAIGFESFQQAMTRKLLKELQTRAVSALP